MKNYSAQNLNSAELEAKIPFFEKLKISSNLNASIEFHQIQSQTSLNIDLFV